MVCGKSDYNNDERCTFSHFSLELFVCDDHGLRNFWQVTYIF